MRQTSQIQSPPSQFGALPFGTIGPARDQNPAEERPAKRRKIDATGSVEPLSLGFPSPCAQRPFDLQPVQTLPSLASPAPSRPQPEADMGFGFGFLDSPAPAPKPQSGARALNPPSPSTFVFSEPMEMQESEETPEKAK